MSKKVTGANTEFVGSKHDDGVAPASSGKRKMPYENKDQKRARLQHTKQERRQARKDKKGPNLTKRQDKRLKRRQKAMERKAKKQENPNFLSKRQRRRQNEKERIAKQREIDSKQRGIVTLEEEEEIYLTSVLEEIKKSKSEDEDSESISTDILKRMQDVAVPKGVVYSKLNSDFTIDHKLYAELLSRENSGNQYYQKMLNFRRNLPVFQMKDDIITKVEENQVTLISGETGCGKTTQVAQFILDDYIKRRCASTCHIICTQPRRISAISVAERVASERNESLGQSCGYIIRLEKVPPRKVGSITFCTLGVLLRFLVDDPYLTKVSHLIIDEIHERDTLSDFLLIVLKGILPYRPKLRVILMSATLNADMFSKFFDNCPMINILGRLHPVEECYLEDFIEKIEFVSNAPKVGRLKYLLKGKKKKEKARFKLAEKQFFSYLDSEVGDCSKKAIDDLKGLDYDVISYKLIISVVDYICKSSLEGAILIFLPGWNDISKMMQMFNHHPTYSDNGKFVIVPVHSKLTSVLQKDVFDRPPRGCRKIVLGTNIVETSVTIDDIVFVIDCGRAKEKMYNPDTNISSLESVWVSKASLKQRRGRAGRVKPGKCYHLFTRYHERTLSEYQIPEMMRIPLIDLCLHIKILKCGKIWEFLSKAMHPPTEKACIVAIKELQLMGALDEKEGLTALGFHLARLPVGPKVGRMILSGAMFSCLDPVLTIAASLESRDPFVISVDGKGCIRDIKQKFSGDSGSDLIVWVNILKSWEEMGNRSAAEFCKENSLSFSTLRAVSGIKKQFASLLKEIGFTQSDDPKNHASNRQSQNINLIKACICAGLYPNVAKISYKDEKSKKFDIKDVGRSGKTVHLHRRSVNFAREVFNSQWIIYFEKMKDCRVYLYDTTLISPYPLLFFGGLVHFNRSMGVDTIEVDKGIKFHCSANTAGIIIGLRKELDDLLSKKISNPSITFTAGGETSQSCSEMVIKSIVDLISFEKIQSNWMFSTEIVNKFVKTEVSNDSIDQMEKLGGEEYDKSLSDDGDGNDEQVDEDEQYDDEQYDDEQCDDERYDDEHDSEGNEDEDDGEENEDDDDGEGYNDELDEMYDADYYRNSADSYINPAYRHHMAGFTESRRSESTDYSYGTGTSSGRSYSIPQDDSSNYYRDREHAICSGYSYSSGSNYESNFMTRNAARTGSNYDGNFMTHNAADTSSNYDGNFRTHNATGTGSNYDRNFMAHNAAENGRHDGGFTQVTDSDFDIKYY